MNERLGKAADDKSTTPRELKDQLQPCGNIYFDPFVRAVVEGLNFVVHFSEVLMPPSGRECYSSVFMNLELTDKSPVIIQLKCEES